MWSVGVITFCMLFGFPPFYADSSDSQFDEHKQLEVKITQGFDPAVKEGFGPWFPADIPVSKECRYLLAKMLEMDVTKRWTAKECLSSKWVRGFESASAKTVPPIVRDALKKFHHTSKFKVEISNLFAQRIDSDHRHEIKKFFEALDTNKDGAISMKEFKEGMLNTFNSTLSEDQLEAIFRNVDLDDDRAITFDELVSALPLPLCPWLTVPVFLTVFPSVYSSPSQPTGCWWMRTSGSSKPFRNWTRTETVLSAKTN